MFEKPFRLHFSSIIEQVFSFFWFIVVVLVTTVFQNIKEFNAGKIQGAEVIISIVVFVLIAMGICLILWLRWRRTYVTLTKETLIYEKRLITKNSTTIGLKNIATVDLEQNLLERLFGTAKIKIDTNSLSTANQTDVKIILKKDKAELFRKQILKYIDIQKQIELGNENIQELYDEETVIEDSYSSNEKYDVQYNFDRVLEHTFFSIPMFSIIYVLGVIGFGALALKNGEIQGQISSDMIGFVFTLLLITVPAIYSMIRNVFKLHNFKAKRVEDKIHIVYGLFTRKKYTIPVEKINAVIIKQPLFARLAKRYSVELVNVGMGEEESESPVMVLMSKKEELKETLKLLLPELEIKEENILKTKQPKEALVPITIQSLIWGLILIVISLFTIKTLTLAIIPFVILVIILSYITKFISIEEEKLLITNGIFSRNTVIIKYEKIQKVQLDRSLITEKLGIEKSIINILASMANIAHSTGYFKNEIFDKILDKVK